MELNEKLKRALSLKRVNKIELKSNLFEDLGMDSLDAIECIMAVEEEFDLDIEDEDCEKFKTVEDIQNYLISKKAITLDNHPNG